MRQIFNVSGNELLSQFSTGDYILAIASDSPYNYAIVFGGFDGNGERYVAMATNADDRFNGNNGSEYRPDGFRYAWLWREAPDKTLAAFIERVEAQKVIHLILSNTAGTTTARATTAAPESGVFINKNYESTTMYTRVQSYHSHHSQEPNKPLKHHSGYKVGVELEVECNNSESHRKCTEIQSNWIYMETDGSLSSRGIEFITIPLRPQDAKKAETWSALIAYVSKYAKSWSKSSCGLHVHIGREILGRTAEQQSETIGKMLFLYHHWLKDCSMNRAIYGRARGYSDNDAKAAEADAARTLGKEVFKSKKLKDTVKKALIDKSSHDRYFDINLSNLATIEFRRGRGSINTARITAVIEYCELICLYAKQARWENICEADFVAYCRKKIAPTSPLARWITSEEACE